MTEDDNERPTLLGPGGEPLPMPGAAAPPQSEPATPAPRTPEPVPDVPPELEEAAPAAGPADAPGQAATGPAYRISVVLNVDPRLMPAALITVLAHDPMDGYRQRVDQTRKQFEQTRDVLIAATEAQLRTQGAPDNEAEAAAVRIVEQQYMSSLWDVAYETVSGNQVAMVYAAALGGRDRVTGTVMAANYDVPKVWVASRALVAGNRFGAWSTPVERERQMPVSVVLSSENFHPLRTSFAKVSV